MSLTQPSFAALLAQGLSFHQNKQWTQAVQAYDAILSVDPGHFDALLLKGLIAFQFKDHPLALELLSHAVQVNPKHPDAHNNLGLVLYELKRHEEALQAFDLALALQPDFAQAWCNRGNVLNEQHQHALALLSYDKAIEFKPDFAQAHCNRGVVLRALEQTTEALASFDRSIALQPDLAQAHNNRGNLLRRLQRFEEALSSLNQAIEWAPDWAEAHINRGNVWQDMLQFEAALDSYRQAIERAPQEADGFWNTALLLLLLGQFELGFELYEWRWKLDGFTSSLRHFDQPLWLGQEPLQGKTILLHAEQGLGDTLQFCRYAPLVKRMGARVILEVPEGLADLLRHVQGVDQCVIKGQAWPAHDLHCPLMSLPLAFKTTLNDIPSSISYLSVSESNDHIWRHRLGPKQAPRVGLVWSGGTAHKYDHKRSMRLNHMLRHLPKGIEYISLQKQISESEQAELQANGVAHHGEWLHDFSQTAALCEQLDLIISVDTSVAHLGGALGKPTWLLLPHVPDWRWLLDRPDSPWYPSMKLYRQDQTRQWSVVMDRIGQDLTDRFQLGAS